MPTYDKNVVMVHAALGEAIENTPNIPPGQYYLPDAEAFIMSLVKITGTVQITMKSVACVIMQHKYELGLDIWDTLSEVTHKLRIVPTLTTYL